MKTKTLLVLFITIMLAVGIAGIAAAGGKQEESETKKATPEEAAATESAERETIVIGISKFVQHPALDAVEQGIMDELKELGWDNISYDLQNANADANTSAQIATKFKSGNVDLAVGIATPTAQALVKSINSIPVIYSAVTDPVSAGLVGSYDKGEENVTGYSDMTPVQAQLELMLEIADVATLGHVYTSGETNAVVLANKAK
jgi:putative tryptophan/tyrosine transport system substrate-binding protein